MEHSQKPDLRQVGSQARVPSARVEAERLLRFAARDSRMAGLWSRARKYQPVKPAGRSL